MTRDEWNSLKPGDVLRWKRPDGTYVLRTVMDTGHKGAITIPIRRRSWTRRIHTTYIFSDIHAKVELHNKKEDRLMTDGEMLNLCECGFDIPQQLHRERGPFGTLKAVPTSKLMGAAAIARKYCNPATHPATG